MFFSSTSSRSLFDSMNLFCQENSLLTCIIFLVLGVCVGSFLNVLALRSLKEESIVFPASYCPNCKHSLSALDNIPLLSYLLLGGKCRYCKERISWQYPLVELCTGLVYAAIAYVFLVKNIPLDNFDATGFSQATGMTHDLFLAIQRGISLSGDQIHQSLASSDLGFYKYGLALGAFVFASTLITVTITDFREKLIPHEITYPSMLFGIAFSAIVRGDLPGAMAGIGASYILFDFIAFYGLKLYMFMHKNDGGEDEENSQSNLVAIDPEIDRELGLSEDTPDEDIEVMGGGDAVLSAVMSAYLGWKCLVLALVVGFLAGTVMGLGLLLLEMRKAGLLKECGRKSIIWGLLSGLGLGCLTLLPLLSAQMAGQIDLLNSLVNMSLNMAMLGFAGGALLGMVSVGTRVSKPFPFGPALALGGFIAMFLIPYLPFYEIGHNR